MKLSSPPPPKMPMLLALEYARAGYFIRPITWTGADGEHELAWLNYPAGAPLAYYFDGSVASPGRRWLVDDLTRAEWLGWWTCLPVACLDGTVEDGGPCLCDVSHEWSWAIYEDETATPLTDDLTNPNAILGLEECDGGCDCAGTGTGGTGTGNNGGPKDGSPAPGGGDGSGGTGAGNDGSPFPGGLGGGGGGGGGGGPKKRPRRQKSPKVGPTITVTATRTIPAESCTYGAQLEEHEWEIELALSNEPNVEEGIYSCRITVLGAVVQQFMLAPGGAGVCTYTESLEPNTSGPLAIGTGSQFGGGAACITGTARLNPIHICGTTPTPTTTPSMTPSMTPSTTPSTTPPSYYTYNLWYSATDSTDACGMPGSSSPFYSADATLVYGSYLYTDTSLTTAASLGWYSDGTVWYSISSGQVQNGTPSYC